MMCIVHLFICLFAKVFSLHRAQRNHYSYTIYYNYCLHSHIVLFPIVSLYCRFAVDEQRRNEPHRRHGQDRPQRRGLHCKIRRGGVRAARIGLQSVHRRGVRRHGVRRFRSFGAEGAFGRQDWIQGTRLY